MNHRRDNFESLRSQEAAGSWRSKLAAWLFAPSEVKLARPWSETIERLDTGFDVTTVLFSGDYALDPQEVLPNEPGDITIVARRDSRSRQTKRYGYITLYEQTPQDEDKREAFSCFQVDIGSFKSHGVAVPAELFELLICDEADLQFKFEEGDRLVHIPAGALQDKSSRVKPLDANGFPIDTQATLDYCYKAVNRKVFGPPTDFNSD